MYSAFFEYLRPAGLSVFSFRAVLNYFYAILFIICSLILLRRVLWWRKYEKIYPSRKSRIINSIGNMTEFLFISRKKGVPPNVYILQAALGYCELFKKEKFFCLWHLGNPYIIITKAEAVEKIISGTKNLKKQKFYSWLQPWLGTGLVTSYGDKWKSRRKLLTPTFHLDILKDFLPVFNEQSQIMLKILERQTRQPWIDVTEPITLCILDIICETAMGISIGAQKDSDTEYVNAVLRVGNGFISRIFNPILHLQWFFSLSNTGVQFKKDCDLLHAFTRQVISEKKKKLLSNDVGKKISKRKTFMDLMLEQHLQNQNFTEEDVREEVDTFLFGGHDTISMALSWALYLIGLHPKIQDKIHEEMDRIFGDDTERPVTVEDIKDMEYLDRVLKESQRLYPSVPIFSRTLSEDVIVDGCTLFKDNDATIFTYGLHRDEKVFPNPEVFDPDRFLPENCIGRHPFAYIPFSAGPRNCIGQRYAVMEGKVILANIFRNFSVESLDPRDKIFLLPEIILRASGPIRCKFSLRRSPVTTISRSTY